MNRKDFIQNIGALSAGMALPADKNWQSKNDTAHLLDAGDGFKKPPYLKQGDIIGITSPAGAITLEEMRPAIAVMESWGYRCQIGNSIGKKDFTYGGKDEERRVDLQQMLDDENIAAIMCARGGYGSVRIVDGIDWSGFKKNPKWLIGFSDITVLLNHIHTHCHTAAIHSKMTNSFPDDWATAEPIQIETILSIKDALEGRKTIYGAMPNPQNKLGTGEGILVGGNLRTMENLSGTPSDITTDGKILFVEDTGEYFYSIDRMFWNLKRTGKLKNLKGLVIGGFKVKQDVDEEPFGKTVQEIVLEKVASYNYPVCFDFPVGHQRANFALKCGVKHRLQVENEKAVLIEI
ncbi:MAG: LD-carboxypeptidase [Chitinophagaceae bacterium]